MIFRGLEIDSYVLANREGLVRMWLGPEARVHLSVEGRNPLGYATMPSQADRDQIASFTAGSEYPDAPWQIAQFFKSRRAGDLVVCARHGFDLRARFEYQPSQWLARRAAPGSHARPGAGEWSVGHQSSPDGGPLPLDAGGTGKAPSA